jgi:hypothetical protein
MAHESRFLAGILLIVLPTVMFGGASILSLLIGDATYMQNPLRQDLWRAGHAHAGVWLILALVALRYMDEANLSNVMCGAQSRSPRSWFRRPFFSLCCRPKPRLRTGSFILPMSVRYCWRSPCLSSASAW